MFRTTVSVVLAALLAACGTMLPPVQQTLGVAPAPVVFDGNVSGQPTEYVFVLVPDDNPVTPGLSMNSGDTIRLNLPHSFKRNEKVIIKSDADTNMTFTKGWPQASVKMAGQYTIGYDEKANAMEVKAVSAIRADGPNAPGIKIIHLRGHTFLNPEAGAYPVTVEHATSTGIIKAAWAGTITVLATAPSARLAATNFHLAPGTNSNFQKVALGQVAPNYLGLLLWGQGGMPLNSVGIAPRDLVHFPRYTGGLLVQDMNGDKVLDPSADKVVGGIIGAGPQGATGQAATSPLGTDGKPMLSGAVLRSTEFPLAAGGGKPNPGLLVIQFRVGNKPGLYRPTFELIGGNSYQFTVEAIEGR